MTKNEVRIIYVDKNHHPKDGISQVVSLIQSNIPDGIDQSTHFLIPKIVNVKIG